MRTSRKEMYAVILGATSLIHDEENWTQGQLARDSDGNEVDPKSPEAVQWCAMGAIHACSHRNEQVAGDLESLLRTIVEEDSGYMGTKADDAEFPSISAFNYFNDEYATHADIIGLFRKVGNRLGVQPDSDEDLQMRIEDAKRKIGDMKKRLEYRNEVDDTDFVEPWSESVCQMTERDLEYVLKILDGKDLEARLTM